METQTVAAPENFTMLCEAGCRHNLCKTCGEPFRLHNQLAKDHPGTVVGIKKYQLCQGCKERGGREPRPMRNTAPTHCLKCSTAQRPGKTKVEDYPGTVEHYAKGLCVNCFIRTDPLDRDKYMKHYKALDKLPDLEARIQYAAPGFYAYLQRRWANDIPAAGSRKPAVIA